jgi:hypothetical protein
MRYVHSSLASHQKLAPHRRHRVINVDTHALPAEHFRRHQTGGAAADNGNRRSLDIAVTAHNLLILVQRYHSGML